MRNLLVAIVFSVSALGLGGCASEVGGGAGVKVGDAPLVWVGAGVYGGLYYKDYPGPGCHTVGTQRHCWK